MTRYFIGHNGKKVKIPTASTESVRKSMKANKSKNTKPEVALRKALWNQGLRGYRIHWKNAPGSPDIAFPSRKIAVFVQGCFWHRCPQCKPKVPTRNKEYWQAKFRKNIERDRRSLAALKKEGWTVLVYWECEVNENLDEVTEGIISMIE